MSGGEEEKDKVAAVDAAIDFAASLDIADEEDKEQEEVKKEQEEVEEMGEVWQRVTKKCKSEMSDDELHTYFDSQLRGVGDCPNEGCDCVAILADRDTRDCVDRHLHCFNGKTKYKQDSIVFEWYKYSSYLKKLHFTTTVFCLPYIDDGTAVVPEVVCMHVLCTRGLLRVLNWGLKRWGSIQTALIKMGVMPANKKTGKQAPHAIEQHETKYEPLMRHFEYLMNLGEV